MIIIKNGMILQTVKRVKAIPRNRQTFIFKLGQDVIVRWQGRKSLMEFRLK